MELEGKTLSDNIKSKLKYEINELSKKDIKPGLGVILVGENIESETYVNMKIRACNELGIYSKVYELPNKIEEDIIIQKIKDLNEDNMIHGILIQLPLPEHINKYNVINSISDKKDVDGIGVINSGKLMINNNIKSLPCTPRGCIELLEHYDISIKSKDIAIIGTSNLVGLPLSIMLLHRGACVTLCNINTLNIKEKTKQADIVIACCGVAEMIKDDWVKEGSIIIDIGINKIDDNKTKKGYRLVGDVDYNNVKDKVKSITPVPGGIGPMTIAILMKQTVENCKSHSLIKKNTI